MDQIIILTVLVHMVSKCFSDLVLVIRKNRNLLGKGLPLSFCRYSVEMRLAKLLRLLPALNTEVIHDSVTAVMGPGGRGYHQDVLLASWELLSGARALLTRTVLYWSLNQRKEKASAT